MVKYVHYPIIYFALFHLFEVNWPNLRAPNDLVSKKIVKKKFITFSYRVFPSLPGCTEYSFHQQTISYKMDDSIYKKIYETGHYKTFSMLIKVQENKMITSDEEIEYGIFALLSDAGGGLGIFLGLSLLR